MNMQLKYPPARRRRRSRRRGKTRSARTREREKERERERSTSQLGRKWPSHQPLLFVLFVSLFFRVSARCPPWGQPRKCPAPKGGKKSAPRLLAFPEPQELFRWLEQPPSPPPSREEEGGRVPFSRANVELWKLCSKHAGKAGPDVSRGEGLSVRAVVPYI